MGKRIDEFGRQAFFLGEESATSGRIEQHIKFVSCSVADSADDIAIRDVVDQRNVLVANSLNVVLTKSIF